MTCKLRLYFRPELGRVDLPCHESIEVCQVGTLQPTTLIACDADIGLIFDATDIAALSDEGLAADDLRLSMIAERKAPTQRLAERLKPAGYAGLQVRSFDRGAGAGGILSVGSARRLIRQARCLHWHPSEVYPQCPKWR